MRNTPARDQPASAAVPSYGAPSRVTRIGFLAVLFSALFAAPASADLAVSLPLGGYYHVGRYMPVRISGDAAAPGLIRLAGSDAMETDLAIDSGHVDVVVPWLVLGEQATGPDAREDQTPLAAGLPLHPLQDDQWLVGYTRWAADASVLHDLFPGKAIVPVVLDDVPMPAASAPAWETLDALVLDQPAAANLDAQRLASLMAAGVVVAVRAEQAPGPMWPWKRQGDYWVLRPPLCGPRSAAFSPAAYRPVYGWDPAWPVPFRKRIVFCGILFSIGIVAATLWRPRRAALSAAALSLAALALLGLWWHFQSPVLQCGGELMFLGGHGDLVQQDQWVYSTSASHAQDDSAWLEITKPIFASRTSMSRSHVTLLCASGGAPASFELDLAARARIALLSRRAGPQAPQVSPVLPATSPLTQLLEPIYLGQGDRILGQLPAAPPLANPYHDLVYWPTVVVRRGP